MLDVRVHIVAILTEHFAQPLARDFFGCMLDKEFFDECERYILIFVEHATVEKARLDVNDGDVVLNDHAQLFLCALRQFIPPLVLLRERALLLCFTVLGSPKGPHLATPT